MSKIIQEGNVMKDFIYQICFVFFSSWEEEAAARWKIPGAEEERQTGELPEQEEEEERREGPQEAAEAAADEESCVRGSEIEETHGHKPTVR